MLNESIAASGGIYGFSKAAAANLREKNDSWNPTIAGFLAGAVLGLRCQVFFLRPIGVILTKKQSEHFLLSWVLVLAWQQSKAYSITRGGSFQVLAKILKSMNMSERSF